MWYRLKSAGLFGTIWYNLGIQFKWIKIYNKERDESLKRAKIALEEAFTPELRKMLDDKINE
jgi:hypothetical protein